MKNKIKLAEVLALATVVTVCFSGCSLFETRNFDSDAAELEENANEAEELEEDESEEELEEEKASEALETEESEDKAGDEYDLKSSDYYVIYSDDIEKLGYDGYMPYEDHIIAAKEGKGKVQFDLLNLDGEVEKSITGSFGENNGYGWNLGVSDKVACTLNYGTDDTICIAYDWDLEKICKATFDDSYGDNYYFLDATEEENVLVLYDAVSGDTNCYIDITTGEKVKYEPDDGEYPNSDEWAYMVECPCIDGYFVENSDGEWGFADADGKMIKMYADATTFSSTGYALVTADLKEYSIINTDFEVVAKDIIDGYNAYALACGGWIRVNDNDRYAFVYVK